MKAGLIYEIESVKPHAADHEYRVFWETMAQIELADRLGFDSVWTVEHHFLNEFSYCSAPEVFLACVTQRTKQIRVGHGVVVLPFSHPIRVAERIAVLDIMSNGRVEFGTGRAPRTNALIGFRRASGRHAAAMGRGGRSNPADVARRSVLDAWQILDRRSAGLGDSQTDPETSSADLGRGDQSADVRACRGARARGAVLHARRRDRQGCGSNPDLSRGNQARVPGRADDHVQPGLDEYHGAGRRRPARDRGNRTRSGAVVRA